MFDTDVLKKAREAPRKSLAEKFAEKPTRKSAIDRFCQECMGGPENGPWKQLIRDCTAPHCPLYGFRPYK